mmetsp:Transcript_24785/g.21992  ORF Transcript_24785/g.21992 Transcript_24785/m.21992 type:complete len:116 (+) Transcript_24785:942-1289(+)
MHPELMDRLFNSNKATKYGVYSINFYVLGKVFEIIVDDYLPTCKSENLSAFGKIVDNQIWVPLIEKAWAKVVGGYANINVGHTEEIWYLLTGAPGAFYKLQDMGLQVLWARLLHW